MLKNEAVIMSNIQGIYTTTLKNGDVSYRVSTTHQSKHISLGSFSDVNVAQKVYHESRLILSDLSINIDSYNDNFSINHDKFIILLNFRDNNIYFGTPIYLRHNYFEYYLSEKEILKFDRDDLFFYARHKIGKKGGYLYISNYGSQYKILSRYGVRPFAVYGRDYIMVNSDKNDFRYSNIKILNNYMGVQKKEKKGIIYYETLIHINGNYIVGRYDCEIEAAVAYNKAADTLHALGHEKKYIKNYIVSLSSDEYKEMYKKTGISRNLLKVPVTKIE